MSASHTFDPVPEKPHFPSEEEKVLAYWREIDAFQTALKQSKGKKPYVFYDGPPFATGLPHYGHILAGTIKDVVTRYAHQQGYHVDRRFGWDCHGLPIEYEIDKKLGIKGRPDVLKMGIDKYNEECRGIVTRYTGEWRTIVERFGRWIDFDNDYKTMGLDYMESCWWVFKELFNKGQVYRAFRVMPFSTACSTPLSNFEVSQNYREVTDPSIIVKFKVADKKDSWILAWTTTPWTLPSNLGLCVHPELVYFKLKKKDDGQEWIVGKDRVAWVCQCLKLDLKKDFTVLEEVPGAKLVGIKYEPLFDYFKGKVSPKAWHIISDSYVTTGAGTCIVHQAPAFGEDDMRACKNHGIIKADGEGMVCPVDDDGRYVADVKDFVGQHVKEADKPIKKMLKEKGNLLHDGQEVHNYPHCWRSDTPLIYKAVASWFIKVEDVREKLLSNNESTNWVPAFVGEKRFKNWLSEARDWCVSRNRYWGTPIPLWCSSDFQEVVCIGSVAELEKLSGRKITDIHRHFIDDIEIPSKQGKGMLKRVDEVFDCWFESGSMPYASKHYPFEGKEKFEAEFPAQFIAEGLDQTRGWFYTLMVLSTHLFDKAPFQNLIVNGLVLAADGKKMSKRLNNYPPPTEMANNYGADAVRMYMCNSPVVRAEPLKFNESGVKDVVKDVFLPWFHAYRFLVQEVTRYETEKGAKFVPDPARVKKSKNTMDRWVNAEVHALIKFVKQEMEAYRLYTVVPRLTCLLDNLTNWYIRLNRDRMRGSEGSEESLTALCTTFEALINVTILLAPVTPFITEFIYQNLSKALPTNHKLKAQSVHFVMIPDFDPEALDADISRAVGRLQEVVEMGRAGRERKKAPMKLGLRGMTVCSPDAEFLKDMKTLEPYLLEELNVVKAEFISSMASTLSATLNFKVAGKKFPKEVKAVMAAVKELTDAQLESFEKTGSIVVAGQKLEAEDLSVSREVKALSDPNVSVCTKEGIDCSLMLDLTPDEELKAVALCRDVTSRVQKLRKEAKLQLDDPIDMWAEAVDPKKGSKLQAVLTKKTEVMNKLLRKPLWNGSIRQGHELIVKKEEFDLDGEKLRLLLTLRGPFFNEKELSKLAGDKAVEHALRQYIMMYTLEQLTDICKAGKDMKVSVGSQSFTLKPKTHFVVSPSEATWL